MNIYSGKIYTSVKITLFKNPACGKGRGGKEEKQKRKTQDR
jgi:hypothetical protein